MVYELRIDFGFGGRVVGRGFVRLDMSGYFGLGFFDSFVGFVLRCGGDCLGCGIFGEMLLFVLGFV